MAGRRSLRWLCVTLQAAVLCLSVWNTRVCVYFCRRMSSLLGRTFKRWMGRKDKSRERMRKIEELRNRRLLDTPWDKPKTIPTFAEVRTSSRVRGFLKRKGISEEKDPADAFEKGWLIASATVLMRAHVVKPRLPEKLRSYQEEKFFFRDERNMPFEEGMFKKEGVLEEPEVDVYFEPPPIESEADRRNDVRSVWRKLDERLYFVFKARAEAKTFMFPQRITGADETMRGSAKKALKLVAGTSITTSHHSGYAPLAVYKRVFGEAQQQATKAYGAKVFFFPSYLIEGDIRKLDQGYDFRWLTKEECARHMDPEYYRSVKDMLF